jgi:hypothetical protein
MSVGYMAKCTRKKRHATLKEAENRRDRMIRQGRWRRDKTNVYPCNYCGGFHAGRLGKSNRGKNRKVKASRILDTQ